MVATDLDRFVEAQDRVWPEVVAELGRGRKTSHWMWFVFPQLRGLGRSPTAVFYGLDGRREAEAYVAHPLLGERLRAGCRLLLALPDRPIRAILGTPDDLKLRSSMTLFEAVEPGDPLFGQVLARFYGGVRDGRTLALLGPGDAGAAG